MLTLDDIDAIELPESIQADLYAIMRAPRRPDEEILANLAKALVEKRSEAVIGRQTTGIEDIWAYCEDAYAGVDDQNRGQVTGAKIRWSKPPSMDGPVMADDGRNDEPMRSTVFVPVTARYTDAAAAKVCEILISPDDKAFSLEATPVPELIDAMEDRRGIISPEGIPYERPATPEELASAGNVPASPQAPPSPPGAPTPNAPVVGAAPAPGSDPNFVPLEVRDTAKEAAKESEKRAKKAEKRLHDWMIEARYSSEMRKVIQDAAKLGTGIMKGPFPTMRRSRAIITSEDKQTITVKLEEKIKPGFNRISAWDFYPDPNCGEDIHSGDYCFERSRLTERGLRDLKKQPGYDKRAIDQVIKEGPNKQYLAGDDRKRIDPRFDTRYEVWYYTGYLTKEEVLAMAGRAEGNWRQEITNDLNSEGMQALTEVPVIATLVNETVIRAVLHPLDSGAFPYHAVPWLTRSDSPWGKGVPEQIEVPQRIINGATRALCNNAGQSAGPQIVIDTLSIEPAQSGKNAWQIHPWKIWKKTSEDMTDDVNKAFQVYEFPNVVEALMAVVEYGFRLCEESTNIPLVTQGQSGKTTPQTLGATQLQDNNANQLLRNVGYRFDDYATEPIVTQLYEYLLIDEEVPNDEKGDWKINAHGSVVLVERHIQQQTIAGMSSIVLNPAFAIDPEKWLEQYLKGNRLNPIDFQLTEEQKKKLASMPPPKDPKIVAAELKAQTDKYKVDKDTDRDAAYVQAETEENRLKHEADLVRIEAETNLELLKYANQHKIELMKAKSKMAEVAMKLSAQKEMAAEDRAGEVLMPPTEPRGRAPEGKSFQA